MHEKTSQRLLHAEAELDETSPIILPGEHLEIFGGTLEKHLNGLRAAHIETANRLESAIKAQWAIQEIMDNTVLALQDPALPVEAAIRQMTEMLKLEKKVQAERDAIQRMYDNQMAEYELIKSEMERIAREHPERFITSPEINE